MKDRSNNSETQQRACVRLHKTFLTIAASILMVASVNALNTPVDACGEFEFDITNVSGVTSEELYEYAPYWCDEQTCELIVNLSREYGISSEFALSVFRYEYVPERNSVGGVKDSSGYVTYNSLESSIKSWFSFMSETYCNPNSWHYSQTNGTNICDIAPLYNQGMTHFNESSTNWCETISKEVNYILQSEK